MPATAVASAPAEEEGMEKEKEKEKDLNSLTEDLVIEVLQHLPLRSLARANCVSKLWRSYISTKCLLRSCRCSSLWGSPLLQGFFFQNSDIPRNGVPINLFFSSSNRPPLHPFPNPNLPIQIVASSNGLLLCGRSNRNPIVQFFVWNPTTNLLISLPQPRNVFTSVKIGFHAEPNCRADSVSFTIVRLGPLGHGTTEIFSSETGDWMCAALKVTVHSLFLPFEGPSAAVLDGVFYWLEFRSLVHSFDLLNNRFRRVILPPESSEYRGNVVSRCLAVAGGALQMASTDGDRIEIWIVRGGKERASWALKRRLSVETLVDNNANIFRASAAKAGRRFLGIAGFQASDPGKIFLNTPEIVVSYDLRSGKVELVHRFGEPYLDVCELTFFPYESYLRPRLI